MEKKISPTGPAASDLVAEVPVEQKLDEAEAIQAEDDDQEEADGEHQVWICGRESELPSSFMTILC